MRVQLLESAVDEVVEPEWGGALSYEALHEIILALVLSGEVEVEFSDGQVRRLVRLRNGWIGLGRIEIDRDAETIRVGVSADCE